VLLCRLFSGCINFYGITNGFNLRPQPERVLELIDEDDAKAPCLAFHPGIGSDNYAKHGTLSIQTFQPKLSKPIIDEIDCVLGKHYGLTDEELDFIINHDIKYRMGNVDDENGEDE
jgi:hypothetical protein